MWHPAIFQVTSPPGTIDRLQHFFSTHQHAPQQRWRFNISAMMIGAAYDLIITRSGKIFHLPHVGSLSPKAHRALVLIGGCQEQQPNSPIAVDGRMPMTSRRGQENYIVDFFILALRMFQFLENTLLSRSLSVEQSSRASCPSNRCRTTFHAFISLSHKYQRCVPNV